MGHSSSAVTTYSCPSTLFTAVGLYNFTSEDPSHLSFKEGDLLSVLQLEVTGWSGVRREEDESLGWVPSEYLTPIDDVTASVRRQVRLYDDEVENRYRNAPVRSMNFLLDDPPFAVEESNVGEESATRVVQHKVSFSSFSYHKPLPTAPVQGKRRLQRHSADGYIFKRRPALF